jgi:peptidoglycan/LPS O-acetylase OafA/YrhL
MRPLMKKHLAVLDGLRGTAAVSIVIFHFSELSIGLAHPQGLWLRHAYLAVDFFFCLSGYVIGYAYDDRRESMTIGQFLTARFVRLHPMVIAGLVLGTASFLFDPFSTGATKAVAWIEVQNAPLWKLAANVLGGLLMLPTWALPNRFGAYFSLNAPTWSLMWEYVASIAYAFFLWRISRRWLSIVVALGAVALLISAYDVNTVSLGFGWGQSLYALPRITFSFGAGLMIFRYGKVLRTRFGYGWLSLMLVLLFIGPFSSRSSFNGAYELAVVLVGFPLIVVLGAGARTSKYMVRLCDLSGRISYPMYMVHYAFIMVFANYHWTRKISAENLPYVIAVLTAGIVLFSYAILILYDEPVRRWFTEQRRMRRRTVLATEERQNVAQ